MTRVLVLASAWKGSHSWDAAGRAMARGVRAALDSVAVSCIRVADGGDQTAETVAGLLHARARTARVSDALGRPHAAAWFQSPGRVAVLDLASACGLHLHHAGRGLRPIHASSRGLGDLMRAALDRGARTIWVGLGGSASTDGGAGALAALGARFLDEHGRALPDGGEALRRLARADLEGLDARLARTRILLLCDVRAPLLGRAGAARTFAPQKGASPAQVHALEEGLTRFIEVVGDPEAKTRAGGGAAGGSGAGLAAVLGARMLEGAAAILDLLRMDGLLAGVDAVVCGEGRFDGGDHAGKVNDEIVRRALRAGTRVAVVCGQDADPAAVRPSALEVCAGGRAVDAAGIERLTRRAIRRLLR